MTQPTGENESFPSDAEFARFVGEAISDDTTRKEIEDAELNRVSELTDKLHTSNVVCLSYPDGTLNPDGLALLEAGLVEGVLPGADIDELAADEQSLYIVCLQLMNMDDPDHAFFMFACEGKKQLIEMWIRLRGVPFTSDWVRFLRDTLPGGDVSEEDVKEEGRYIEDTCDNITKAIEELVTLFESDIPPGSPIDEEMIRVKAKHYLEAFRQIVDRLIKGVKMSAGELSFQLKQLETKFAISNVTNDKCVAIAFRLFGYSYNSDDLS